MVDVYRAAAKQCPPACMHCLTPMAFDAFWTHHVCKTCGDCDCEPAEKESEDT